MKTNEKPYTQPSVQITQIECETIFALSDTKFTNESYDLDDAIDYVW